jgi:small subunit ribosomal protein S20
MANIKSAIKKIRVDARRKAINDDVKEKYKSAIRDVRKALDDKKGDTKDALANAFKQIDKAAQKNVIHSGKADRLKSRLASKIAKASK